MDVTSLALIDLHLHYDGSLSSEAIIHVANHDGIKLPTYDKNELDKLVRCPKEARDLNDYLSCFDLPLKVLQTKYGLKYCFLDLCNRLESMGLIYVEIRFAPVLHTLKGLSQLEVVDLLSEVVDEYEKSHKLKINLILCMMRNASHIDNLLTIEIAKKYNGKHVAALDLAGAEALYPNELFNEEFNKINEYKLNLTIHAGEASNYNSVLSALKYHPTRIGHGVRSVEDEYTLELLKSNNVILEICPTSNLNTKIFDSYKDIPLNRFIEKGIKFTINTDNLLVSSTSLKDEYLHLYEAGISIEVLEQCTLTAIEASFLNVNDKFLLKSEIDKILENR